MLATSLTAAVLGVDAHLVRVEADTALGFPKFTMVGLPDTAVKESESRIRAALRNCGYAFKWDRRITVNLAPAGLRKVGASYDLATAVGLLCAEGVVPQAALPTALLVGELALDGTLRGVPGVLPMLLMARAAGLASAIVPAANRSEASLVPGVDVFPAATLPDAVDLVANLLAAPADRPRPLSPLSPLSQPSSVSGPDLALVRGQLLARRALEIAAAGGHNLLLVGPPGSGKTLLARCLPGILPALSPDEALEASAIHSAAGLLSEGLLTSRPFRSPHHTASQPALVGGGALPRPGEISLAHHGVLFLDELPEFRRASLEALRQPLEEGHVTLSRARGTLRLPARFQLVAAMNPCPCGAVGGRCSCTPTQARAYARRISGPLLDRIDLRVEVGSVSYPELTAGLGEPAAAVRARVERARGRQLARTDEGGVAINARLGGEALRRLAAPDAQGRALLAGAVDRLSLSARGHDRVLRLARTLADLEAKESIEGHHVAEALQFRGSSSTRLYGGDGQG
jgi:magnesium chelatase family protein